MPTGQTTRATDEWASVEAAIFDAICVAAELSADHVRWKYKNTNQPPDPYIDLGLTGIYNPGQDGLIATTDLTRPRGKEVELQVVGLRQAILQMEAWTAQTSATAEEGADAIALLDQVRTAMIFPDFKGRLYRVGVSVLDRSDPVNFIPSIVRAGFRGRATLDIRLNIPAPALRQYTGYIETISGRINVGLTGPATDIPIPFRLPDNED